MNNNKNTAIVTGATGAIGTAIARQMAEKEFNVFVVARDENKARKTVEQIIDEHPCLPEEGIYAAPAFASEALRADVVYPIQPEGKEGAKTSESSWLMNAWIGK